MHCDMCVCTRAVACMWRSALWSWFSPTSTWFWELSSGSQACAASAYLSSPLTGQNCILKAYLFCVWIIALIRTSLWRSHKSIPNIFLNFSLPYFFLNKVSPEPEAFRFLETDSSYSRAGQWAPRLVCLSPCHNACIVGTHGCTWHLLGDVDLNACLCSRHFA